MRLRVQSVLPDEGRERKTPARALLAAMDANPPVALLYWAGSEMDYLHDNGLLVGLFEEADLNLPKGLWVWEGGLRTTTHLSFDYRAEYAVALDGTTRELTQEEWFRFISAPEKSPWK